MRERERERRERKKKEKERRERGEREKREREVHDSKAIPLDTIAQLLMLTMYESCNDGGGGTDTNDIAVLCAGHNPACANFSVNQKLHLQFISIIRRSKESNVACHGTQLRATAPNALRKKTCSRGEGK